MDPRLPHLAADVHHDLGRGAGPRGRRWSGRRSGRRGGGSGGRLVIGRHRPHHFGRRHGLGAPAPEVLDGEGGRDDEHDGERQRTAPLQPVPRLHPQRHPLPHREPRPLPPAVHAVGGDGAGVGQGPADARGVDAPMVRPRTDACACARFRARARARARTWTGAPPRRPVRRLPSVTVPFGEEHPRPSAEFVRRGLPGPRRGGAAPDRGAAVAGAAVGAGLPAGAAGRGGADGA